MGSSCGRECSVRDQDCPRDERCNVWANDGGADWNAVRCVPLDPDPGGLGDPCTAEGSAVSGIDTCDAGLICMHVDANLEGVCIEFCQGTERNPSCSDSDAVCMISNDDDLQVCVQSCDPFVQDCAAGLGCYGIGIPGSGAPTTCLIPGEGVNSLGLRPAGCEVGETDIPDDLRSECTDEMETCCAPWCSTAEVDPCGPGMLCLPWDEDTGELGVCIDA